MDSVGFLRKFRKVLSPADAFRIIPCLRQDPLIWRSLQDPDFSDKVFNTIGNKPALWHPAMLALLALGIEDSSESLFADATLPLENNICQAAIRVYESTLNAPQAPANLKQAGLLALALRERRRLQGSWQGLANEFQVKKGNEKISTVWQTPLACVLALVSDPMDLYNNLLPPGASDSNEFIHLVIHILTCNPLSEDDRLAALIRLLESRSSEEQLNFLELIDLNGHLTLARELANYLSNSKNNKLVFVDTEGSANNKDPLTDPDVMKKIVRLEQLASIHRLSGFDELAVPSLAKACEYSGILQAQLTFKLAQLAHHNHDGGTSIHALQQVNDLVPGSAISRIYLANELVNADRVNEAQAYLPQSIDGTLTRLTSARIACANGDKDLAKSIINEMVDLAVVLESEERYNHITSVHISNLTSTFLDHGMPDQAKTVLEIGLKVFPTDLDLLNLFIKTNQANGHLNDAIAASYITALLQPDEIAYKKQLADLLEQNGDFENAFDERKQIIASSPVPLINDLILLANSALKADHPQVTVSISKGILANDPDNGDAILCLGEAYLSQMNFEEAIASLKQAVLISPENPKTWLNLSLAYRKDEDQTKALETLQSAANVIPECADIHFALAQLMLVQRTNSEALPYLRAAYNLAPGSEQAALQFSKTLDQLGHVYEADSILEASRKLHPDHPELALMHGQILANLGRYTEAWKAFQIGLKIPSNNAEALVAYGKTVISLMDALQEPDSCSPDLYQVKGLDNHLDVSKVIEYVNTAVKIDPANIEARLLLADLLNADQQYEQALNQYYEVSKFDQAKDIQLNWRIIFGQGKTALKLGHLDAALISLREAASLKPDQIRIQQTLADAYYQANFHAEALEIAKTVLMLAPQMLDNLIWHSEMMEKLGELPEAINSLEKASQLSPERLDLSLRAARYEHLSGHDDLASKVLDQVISSHLPSCTDLQQASSLYFEIGNPKSAIACLENAVSANPTPAPELMMMLIKAYEATSNPSAALNVIQRVMDIQPGNPDLYYQKAELLIKNNQSVEALACLQDALNTKLVDTNTTSINTLRFLTASLLRQAGRLSEALEYVRIGLNQEPHNLELQSFEAELAFSLCMEIESHLDDHLNASIEIIHQADDNCTNKFPVLNLLCIDAEIALEQANLEAADAVISAAVQLAPEHPRVMAALSRLALMSNDLDGALRQWEAAVTSYNNIKQDATSLIPFAGDNNFWSALAIAEASFTLQKWQTALDYYQKAAQLAPYEPKPQLRFARALTLAAEHQRHCQALMVVTHAPGPSILSDEIYQIFCESFNRIKAVIDNPEMTRWQIRGMAAFKPDHESAKTLADHITDASDAAAAISALLAVGSEAESIIPTEQFQDSPEVLFEIALASLAKNPEKSYQTMQSLLEPAAYRPLYLALLAFSNQHELAETCQSIELALAAWPDEPQWHAFAAEKYQQAGDLLSAMRHWQQATWLNPESVPYKLAYATNCFEAGEIEQALQAYNQITKLDPENQNAWYRLAEANKSMGKLSEALNCAEQACALDPNDIHALILSGQIAFELGEKEMAFQKAKAVIEVDPNEVDGILLYAQTMEKMGFVSEALSYIEQSLLRIQAPYQCLIQRALLVRQVHGSNQALPYFQELAQDFGDKNEVLSPYAEILIETGQLDLGETVAQASLQIDTNQPKIHLLLGRLQRFKGQLDQAIYHLCESIKQSPNQIEPYLELGRAYHDRREHGLAIKTYRQATRISPDDPRPYYHASLALKECKDYVAAETMLRYAARLAPNDVNIHRQLGAIIALNLVHNPHEVSIKQ